MYLFVSGPPGIGKTTVGALLAELLGAVSLDIDAVIARREHQSAEGLIKKLGLERFRDLETEVLSRLESTPAWTVVAVGGGTALRAENRARMRELGIILCLSGSLATVTRGLERTMAKRVHLSETPREHAKRVLAERRTAYADADARFVVDGVTAGEVARAIAAWLASSRGVRIEVQGERPYPVHLRAGLLADAGRHLAELGWSGAVAVVSDPTIARLHGPVLLASLAQAGLVARPISVPTGERAKSLPALRRLWNELAAAGIGRDGGVIALGGGATGDVAGFAAATYLRGIRFAQIPTTLLAMVDSSIGSKTGIDLAAGKNLAGAFHPPSAVLADLAVLQTLPARQVSNGLAEVIKSAYLVDRPAVAQVSRTIEKVRSGDLGGLLATISLTVEIKARVVSEDERESGIRELLNFGHTFGHAYEAAMGYRVGHGEAVAVGLVFATALAEQLGLAPGSLRLELEELLVRSGLPVRAKLPATVWSYLQRDKKVRAGKVRWILPRRIGRFSEVTDVNDRSLRAAAKVVTGGRSGR
ncbi:MAG: 3-dehydroquinate synthase [Chloroflexi bacterium]|nr:3-dehydroquinate synthase [Chloroflexota bacterium]